MGKAARQRSATVSEGMPPPPPIASCICPHKCLVGAVVDPLNPADAVLMECSNGERCPIANHFIHKECLEAWEDFLVNALERGNGRGRQGTWSEKQRYMNLWNKKGQEGIFRLCACRCNGGHITKAAVAPAPRPAAGAARKRRKSTRKDLPVLGDAGHPPVRATAPGKGGYVPPSAYAHTAPVYDDAPPAPVTPPVRRARKAVPVGMRNWPTLPPPPPTFDDYIASSSPDYKFERKTAFSESYAGVAQLSRGLAGMRMRHDDDEGTTDEEDDGEGCSKDMPVLEEEPRVPDEVVVASGAFAVLSAYTEENAELCPQTKNDLIRHFYCDDDFE